MKVIIQIPCFNEEQTLPAVWHDLPTEIPGVDQIEVLIIDDGSTDKTVEVAQTLGVHHIVRHPRNRGLAAAFTTGLNEALRLGADIIVNTDGDNQYPQQDIPRLVQPLLESTHDVAIGDRRVGSITHFSPLKKFLQKVGSNVVQRASATEVADAPCGFRAYSREAAMRINMVTDFSYTLETIIQAGHKRLSVANVAITTNVTNRKSRLFKSISQYVRRSAGAIVRSYTMYKPFKVFMTIGTIIFLIGTIPYFRILYLMVFSGQLISGHLQSLLLGAVFIILGFLIMALGVLADLLAINRRLLEDVTYRVKKIEYGKF